jgi:hypothetical protein
LIGEKVARAILGAKIAHVKYRKVVDIRTDSFYTDSISHCDTSKYFLRFGTETFNVTSLIEKEIRFQLLVVFL